jgi:hypothetical protein
MQVLSPDHARDWCAIRGLTFAPSPRCTDARINNGIRFLTEGKQAVTKAVIRCIVGHYGFDEAIVWITDWPLYRPDEMAVVMRLRASVGELRRLIDAPAHLFGSEETADCIGLFNLCIQYYWDALLFVPASGLFVFNSHDGIQYVSSLSEPRRNEIKEMLVEFDLELLSS